MKGQERRTVIADIRNVLVFCRLLEVCPVGSVMMMMRWPERVGATAGFFERAKDRPGWMALTCDVAMCFLGVEFAAVTPTLRATS